MAAAQGERAVRVSTVYLPFSPQSVPWLARVHAAIGDQALTIFVSRGEGGELVLKTDAARPAGLTDAERAALREAVLRAYREKLAKQAPQQTPPLQDEASGFWRPRDEWAVRRLFGD